MLLKAAGCIVSYWFEQMNYTYKKIWLIAFPVMMSILIEQLINITDALFLGHVGDVELGASALAGIWFLAIYMLGFGFSLGLQVVIARRNGEQRYAETGKTFFQGLFFLLILAVLLCLLSKIFSSVLLKHLITSDDVYNAVIRYLDWRIWGLLFSFPVPCITLVFGRHYTDKSSEHGSFHCRTGKHSAELAPDIRLRYGYIGSGYRFFICRNVFAGCIGCIYVSAH